MNPQPRELPVDKRAATVVIIARSDVRAVEGLQQPPITSTAGPSSGTAAI